MEKEPGKFQATAIVTTFYCTVGGISTFTRKIVEYSIDKQNIIVITPDNQITGRHDNVVSVKARSRAVVVIKTFIALKRNRIGYVQCHGTWYLLLACLIYKYSMTILKKRVAVISVQHSDMNIPPKSFKRKLLQFLGNQSDSTVFVSNHLKDKFIRDLEFEFRHPVYIVNPGSDRPTYEQHKIAELTRLIGENHSAPVLTYIGLFEYEGKVKGLILLLEVVKKLTLRYPKLLLMIAGKGSFKNLVDDAIDKLSLQDNVRILEDITNPYNLLKVSDLHCHVTHQDGFPLTVLEALSAGVPVVASATGELPNVGVTGLVVVANEVDALSMAILQCIQKPPGVDSESLAKKFNWTRTAAKLNTIMRCGIDD